MMRRVERKDNNAADARVLVLIKVTMAFVFDDPFQLSVFSPLWLRVSLFPTVKKSTKFNDVVHGHLANDIFSLKIKRIASAPIRANVPRHAKRSRGGSGDIWWK
jgi:hypothetical protein